jgi:hypothetical protein
MSKIYATTMLVILNNRIKIIGGRFDNEGDEESRLTGIGTSRTGTSGERRNSRTKIFVSNGRLTFQLASDTPPSPITENSGSPSSVVCH